jgi:transcriptional regulator with XRE-family HTH domain
MHRLAAVRQQEGLSHRCLARRMGITVRQVQSQELETTDLRLSELYRWQKALDVPFEEMLNDGNTRYSDPVTHRGQMLRIMKTACSIQEDARRPSQKRLAETLINQLLELMPELHDAGSWHSVGQRRTTAECGQAGCRVVSSELFREE